MVREIKENFENLQYANKLSYHYFMDDKNRIQGLYKSYYTNGFYSHKIVYKHGIKYGIYETFNFEKLRIVIMNYNNNFSNNIYIRFIY